MKERLAPNPGWVNDDPGLGSRKYRRHLRDVKILDLRPRFRHIGPQGIAGSFVRPALVFSNLAVGACRYAKRHTIIPRQTCTGRGCEPDPYWSGAICFALQPSLFPRVRAGKVLV